MTLPNLENVRCIYKAVDVIGCGGVAGSSTDMDHADGDQTVLLDTTVINACTQDG